MWTKDRIQNLLRTSDKAVERACIAIYDRQMQDEKRSNITCHDNTIGFSSAHASKGSYYARWCLGGRRLNGIHLVKARAMMMHYHRQLCEIANAGQKGATKIVANPYRGMTPADRASALANVRAGKCPDGCCGGHESIPTDHYLANKEEIDQQEDAREARKEAMLETDECSMPLASEPPIGSWAQIARDMVRSGFMSGDEADRWKDEMKDREMGV